MPRNFHRKDRRQQKLPNKDSAKQASSGWKHNKATNRQLWWGEPTNETYPRLGQHIVSSPHSHLSSQKHKSRPTRSLLPYQRSHMVVSGRPGKFKPQSIALGLFRPSSWAMMTSSSEIKEYLLQRVKVGKRRIDDWIISEFEMSTSGKDIIIWESCAMDWQPEETVVIPQAVNVQYPWDSAGETEKQHYWKRSGWDILMEDTS